MSLPPIFSNLSVFKLFKPDQNQSSKSPQSSASSAPPASLPKDVVSLSPKALDKLKNEKTISEGEARPLAQQTGAMLRDNYVTLSDKALPE